MTTTSAGPSAVASAADPARADSPTPRITASAWDRIRGGALALWSGLALLYLFLPIFIVVLFSFNDPQGRYNFTWEGFTLDHWKDPFAVEGLGTAVANSLEIALISTAIALVLGTGVALALVRHRFRGRGA